MGAILHTSPQKNRILAALPQEDFDRFFSSLQPVSLAQRQVLYPVGAPLECIYFIEAGVACVLTSMTDGSTIEVGMIGREGIAGAAALLGGDVSAQHVVIQAPSTALRMNAAECRAAFEESAAVRAPVLRYVQTLLDLSAQTAACNRLHSIEQRCARWLLMARDRLDDDVMPMTHEFLATMLGVRRAGGHRNRRRAAPLGADPKSSRRGYHPRSRRPRSGGLRVLPDRPRAVDAPAL